MTAVSPFLAPMALYRSILHPTDFSASAEAAFRVATEWARDDAQLHLFYVDTVPGGSADEEALRERLVALGREVSVPARTAVALDLAPAPAILRYAEGHHVDLIVMGIHGRRGLSRLLLGSTAREVVQLAPCPVLTVRPPEGRGATPSPRGGTVLVPVDFSETAREALRHAARVARAFGARLDLLHVIEELFRPVGYGYTLRSVYEVEPDIEQRLGEALRVFRDEVAEDVETYGPMEILPGPPARAIVEAAERQGSTLIVMGTQGLRGLDRLVMGSVAEEVVRTAPCPVLTVRAPESARAARTALVRAADAPAPLHTEPLPTF